MKEIRARVVAAVVALWAAGCGGGHDNIAPLARIASQPLIQAGATVVLDGSSSTDADGDGLSYSWTLTGFPVGSTASLSGASSVNPRFVADLPGSYTVSLVVSDASASSLAASLAVVAARAGIPAAISAVDPTDLTVVQHAKVGTLYTVKVTDAFGNPVVQAPVTFSSAVASVARPSLTGNTFADGTASPKLGGVESWISYFHQAGSQAIVASTGAAPPVTFKINVTPSTHAYDGLYACNAAPTSLSITNGVFSTPFSAFNGSFDESTGAFRGSRGSGIFKDTYAAQTTVDSDAVARMVGTSTPTAGSDATGPSVSWSCIRY